ncbi:hypothetical protein NJ76_32085 [Rhodococcus sp. IITR03]|nr:hypothetical protein NJ76_32085 [Rhodococcus sp. IITR03]
MAERVLVTLDGEVRDADAPLLHADDFGVLRGDGVFETLLVRGTWCARTASCPGSRRPRPPAQLPEP